MDEVVNAEFLQVQDCGGKVGAKDFWIGGLNELLLEGRFGVEAEAFTRPGAACSPRALLSGGFRDGGDEKGFNADAGVVDFLLAKARIDDVDNPINGKRGFGDIGGYDALPSRSSTFSSWWRGGLEDFLLLLRRQCTVKGVDLQWTCVRLPCHLVCF